MKLCLILDLYIQQLMLHQQELMVIVYNVNESFSDLDDGNYTVRVKANSV